jgi:hypothetical protein
LQSINRLNSDIAEEDRPYNPLDDLPSTTIPLSSPASDAHIISKPVRSNSRSNSSNSYSVTVSGLDRQPLIFRQNGDL